MAGKKKMVAKLPEADDKAKTVARLALCPSVNAAGVVSEYGKPFGDLDLKALVDALTESIELIQGGDVRRCEAMLMGQAHALQAIFMNLSRRAIIQESLNAHETFLRLALKAQSQCRTTLEALAEIKNPRSVAFVKQANIAHGPQQVNNGVPNDQRAREETTIQSNELLTDGVEHGPALDTRGTATASGADKELATVGAIDRPAL